MDLRFRKLTKDDFFVWEELAKSEFSKEDFCDAKYLVSLGDKLMGWCLLNDKNEWIGCCFVSLKKYCFNREGVHFLEICTFPKYRNKGYGKYLLKIMFDNTKSKKKSVCIQPNNADSVRLFEKYGFVKGKKHKYWNLFYCNKDFYPQSLENLHLTEIMKEI